MSAKMELIAAGQEESKLYSKRLLKAKQKELEKKIYKEENEAEKQEGKQEQFKVREKMNKMEVDLMRLKKDVYVNEWKVE